MKQRIIIAFIAIAGTFGWKVAARVTDTNLPVHFDVLVAGGRSYTNATIIRTTPAEAIVNFNQGIARVALSNLPVSYQEKFGYDPAEAARYLDGEKQLELKNRAAQAAALAAYQNAIAARRGTNRNVRIVQVVGNYGFMKCAAVIDGEQREIYVRNLPGSVGDYLAQVSRQKADIAAFQAKVDADAKAAERADALAPTGIIGDTDQASAAMTRRIQANQMALNVKNERDTLAQMQASLADLTSQSAVKTTIVAFPEGQNYGNLPIWNYVGMTP